MLAGFTLVATIAGMAFASGPTFWRLESQDDFLAGRTDGISVGSDGTLSLAPPVQVLNEGTDPHFWSLALAPSGDVIVGSGNEGRIHRIDSSGAATIIADTNELQVHALAVDEDGYVYAGTSPRGVVHRIDSSGAQEVFFDPEDRYIWDLAIDSRGDLIVATGDKPQIYRVDSSGFSEILFTSEETHIVSLALHRDGTIYAGTEPNGLVLRIDPNGTTTVLFDTPFQEVRALATDSAGHVYAATLNGGSRAPTGSSAVPAVSTSSTSATSATVTVTTSASPLVTPDVAALQSSSSPSNGNAAGAVYRIDPDGAAERIWQSARETPLSLALARGDRLVVGTGTDGRVFVVNQDGSSALLLSVEADQVTDVLTTSDGHTLIATSNPAKLYRLNRGRRTMGVYRSPPKDTTTVSAWGKIRWDARTPTGTSIELETRSGNSAEPDNTWSDWSASQGPPEGAQITSPRSRFLQWRATLHSTGETSPELLNVTSVYLQQNLAPTVTEITVHGPGQTFQKPLITTGQTEILGLDSALRDGVRPESGAGADDPSGSSTIAMATMSRPIYNKGYQTVTWKASDPNQDALRYEVFYRAEGESLWRTLREDLTTSVITWDTVAMPDGRYTLRVVADDTPSNPSERSRTGEKSSRSFEVDNTPPRAEQLDVSSSAGAHQVRFVAKDDISAVRQVEYAVNSGPWSVVFPSDGIADSTEESYDFTLDGYADGGVYTLVIKLTDLLGNSGTARAELRSGARRP